MAKVVEVLTCVRTEGPRAALRRHGWRLVLIVFTYYLIRDTLIYIVLPWLLLG